MDKRKRTTVIMRAGAIVTAAAMALLPCININAAPTVQAQEGEAEENVQESEAEEKENVQISEAEEQENARLLDVTNNESRELFGTYLKEALIPTYGVFKRSQSAVIHSQYEEWLEPCGIISATLFDFDNDNKLEMLLCYSKADDSIDDLSEEPLSRYAVYLDMYEIVNGQVVLASEMPFCAYSGGRLNGSVFIKNEWRYVDLEVNVVHSKDKSYIVCQEFFMGRNFADISWLEDWALVYENGNLQFALSYTQNSIGSDDDEFEYIGYEFNDGQCISSQKYYDDEYYKKYEYRRDERAKLFGKYGIEIGSNRRLRQDAENITPVFRFVNEAVISNYGNDEYGYAAILSVYGESLEENGAQGDSALRERLALYYQQEKARSGENFARVTVRRADECALSFIEKRNGLYIRSYNFDAATGKDLMLSDVVTDMDILNEEIVKRLSERYPDIDLGYSPSGRVRELCTERVSSVWTIGYSGLNFYFLPEMFGMPKGELIVVSIAFLDMPELFNEKYTQAPETYIIELEENVPLLYDIDSDGQDDLINVLFYQNDERKDTGIKVNEMACSGKYDGAAYYGDDRKAYLLHISDDFNCVVFYGGGDLNSPERYGVYVVAKDGIGYLGSGVQDIGGYIAADPALIRIAHLGSTVLNGLLTTEEEGKKSTLLKEETSYTGDGNLDYMYLYSYDEQRNVSEERGYDSEWKLERRYSNEYDSHGNCIEYSGFNPGGPFWGESAYTYDEQGNAVKSEHYKQRPYYEKTVCIYNVQGKVTEESVYYSDGKLDSKSVYTYDEQGKRIKEQKYDGDGILKWEIVYIYDEQGNRIEAQKYDEHGILEWNDIYVYDEYGNWTEAEYYDGEGKLKSKYVYKYDNNGDMTEEQYYRGEELKYRNVYFNFRGKIIEQHYDESGIVKEEYISIYDSLGNIIKYERYDEEGKLSYYREYYYYFSS